MVDLALELKGVDEGAFDLALLCIDQLSRPALGELLADSRQIAKRRDGSSSRDRRRADLHRRFRLDDVLEFDVVHAWIRVELVPARWLVQLVPLLCVDEWLKDASHFAKLLSGVGAAGTEGGGSKGRTGGLHCGPAAERCLRRRRIRKQQRTQCGEDGQHVAGPLLYAFR